ncbi:hypothetical protein Nepgr_014076 [Nepenthes gracilis]|uniref:Uncharacterized protein n=1 Tax=Nepenthes gracilis TaxID=150966 RepID=A0AAD3SK17_NEPGR|nr:hypothetical protein Nepgr_014076 [Nepenthes gracilis]
MCPPWEPYMMRQDLWYVSVAFGASLGASIPTIVLSPLPETIVLWTKEPDYPDQEPDYPDQVIFSGSFLGCAPEIMYTSLCIMLSWVIREKEVQESIHARKTVLLCSSTLYTMDTEEPFLTVKWRWFHLKRVSSFFTELSPPHMRVHEQALSLSLFLACFAYVPLCPGDADERK